LPMSIWYRDMIRDALQGEGIAFSAPYSIEQTREQLKSVRPFVGQAQLIIVEASVLVASRDGRVLGLRSKSETCWRLPAGFARLGENVAKTAVRRVWEEIGQQAILERIVGIYSAPEFHTILANGEQLKPVGPLFRARLAAGDELRHNNDQIEAAWKRPEELAAVACDQASLLLRRALPHWKHGYFVC